MAEDLKKAPMSTGLPEMPEEIVIAPKKEAIDWKRIPSFSWGWHYFFFSISCRI